MSIRVKINLVLLVIGVVTSILVAAFNYYEARNRVFSEAQKKAELISSFAMASREYTKQTMRPLAVKMAGKDSFYPELMAGFFVVRSIADIFAESQKGYSFKQATINPILPQNKSNPQETEIINYFRSNRNVLVKKGTLSQSDKQVFYVARPVVNKKGCMKCHGRKEDAPKEQRVMYTGNGGYGWQVNDVVAALITYVPIETALDELKTIALKTIMAGFAAIAVIMLSISFFLNRIVVKPIVNLTTLTERMSRGKDLDKTIENTSNDEIGALCDSFNRMRVSVVKLIQMIKKKK
ncbi:MAG: DUF3365 domain-containing protein [Desulfocapsaceae bacterium]|nr:DUF3365 domain-containing protein [Desulfocapsaceae bacterium]